MQSHINTCVCIYVYMLRLSDIYTDEQINTYTHVHAHTYTYIHAYIHVDRCPYRHS